MLTLRAIELVLKTANDAAIRFQHEAVGGVVLANQQQSVRVDQRTQGGFHANALIDGKSGDDGLDDSSRSDGVIGKRKIK